MTVDLIRDVDSLVGLVEEICKAPDSLHVEGNRLLDEIMGLVGGDYLSAVNEVSLRLSEFMERLSCLSFGESVELMCGLNRLEDCKERLVVGSFTIKKPSTETLWGLIGELKNRVGMLNVYREGGKLVSVGRREKGTESARFADRVVKYGDSVQFSSSRFGLDKLSFMVLN